MAPIPERIVRLDGGFYIRAQWKLCRVVWPRRCEISGRKLWPGTLAYRGRVTRTEDIIEEHWHDKAEHVVWQLKE
jgi:hypothetical protein